MAIDHAGHQRPPFSFDHFGAVDMQIAFFDFTNEAVFDDNRIPAVIFGLVQIQHPDIAYYSDSHFLDSLKRN
ncbi:hypothetical protein [Herbaspirillum sp. RV1423]|uniref:hypothetical protein n=1 Tax=Herbaspirillum sp. RV1423 TaxID=1443993 RepID=UPI001E59C502|nr:hypothetical protein [Herbaspirillum sp. RV1423]